MNRSSDISNNPINQVQPEDAEKCRKNMERDKYIYELVNGWIVNADNKVNVSCAVFTMVFGVLTFIGEKLVKRNDAAVTNVGFECCFNITFIASLVLIALAMVFYMLAIIPNLKSSKCKGKRETKCPIYYGDINSMDEDEYRLLMNETTDQNFSEELIHEIHFNSGICMKKMQNYTWGVKLSFAAIFGMILSIIFRLLMYC